MRIMAVDFGDARTGIAVSDALGIMTGDAFTVKSYNAEKAACEIADIAKSRGVSAIVVGNPRNMDGTEGERSSLCKAFAETLREKTGLAVTMWDERRTTVDAHRILHDNGRKMKDHRRDVDAVAASLILEAYLASAR